jgi:hypothetical protein
MVQTMGRRRTQTEDHPEETEENQTGSALV